MYYPVLKPHLTAKIAASPGARAEFEAAWRTNKADIRGAALERLVDDGLLIITPNSDGWDNLHFTDNDDPGVKMVKALMAEDAEEFHPENATNPDRQLMSPASNRRHGRAINNRADRGAPVFAPNSPPVSAR